MLRSTLILLGLASISLAAPTPDRLAERIILLAPAGSAREDREIGHWQERVRSDPTQASYYERLGWAYVGKARRTLDAGYYKLAEKTADAMDARFGASPASELLRGHVLHNLHRFREAEAVARRLVAERGLPYDFGLLSDALMEQGKLDEAVQACQREMNLRPGLESYSRAAHLRWLKGDLPGAIAAMEAAVRAGSPLDPASSAWTYSRLSLYYLQAGSAPRALLMAETSCRRAPDYPPALLARGRALAAEGEFADAVGPLTRAAALNPLPEYQWWLADALRAAGRSGEAAKVEAALRGRGEAADPRTLSLFLATRGVHPEEALRLARAELDNRADVFTYDALAWSLAARGDYASADAAMRTALAEHTADARLYLHAGEIALARGQAAAAQGYFRQARPLAGALTPSERALLEREELPAHGRPSKPLPIRIPQYPQPIMNPSTSFRFAGLLGLLAGSLALGPATVRASSHMDAPLITLDPAANTTDVYAFVAQRAGQKYLEIALGVYPFEEPGIGPNKYNFDDNVLYQVIVSEASDLAAGNDTVAYQFQFTTHYQTQATILQSYTGVVMTDGDSNQNLYQTYTVTKVTNGGNTSTVLGTGIVPPNNQGIATPLYNQGNNGNNPAKPGVTDPSQLDTYTSGAIASLSNGYRSWAGQREDGFYGDINSIFDLLQLRTGAGNSFDSQSGYNIHLIALEIPVTDIGGASQVVGVYATTSRRQMSVLSSGAGSPAPALSGSWVQVARQGNPLFNEAFVAIQDKDMYGRTKPSSDATLFQKYAANPELAKLVNAITFSGQNVAPTTNRTDLVGIFIPDMIKVDLSTGPARLAAGGAYFPQYPDDAGFSNQSIFGGDTLTSTVQAGFGNGTVPGGWPNGRRFGDDVISIGVTAVISDLRTSPLTIRSAANIDNVAGNDAVYNKVFPYAGTPFNGRNYQHNPGVGPTPVFDFATRGMVGSGAGVLIGGFIVQGQQPVTVLVRATGPSLAAYGVPNAIPGVAIAVYSGSNMIGSNSGWQTGTAQQTAALQATGLAPTNANESAVLLTVQPGAYTFILSGMNGSTGIALGETFVITPTP